MTREQLFRLAEMIRHGLLDPSVTVEELAVRVAAEAVRIAENVNSGHAAGETR